MGAGRTHETITTRALTPWAARSDWVSTAVEAMLPSATSATSVPSPTTCARPKPKRPSRPATAGPMRASRR